MKRKVNAIWQGGGANGQGILTAQSGAFNEMPYSFKTRFENDNGCLLYTSPSPRDRQKSRMPSSA